MRKSELCLITGEYIYINIYQLKITVTRKPFFIGDVNQKNQKKPWANDFLKGTLGGWTEQSKVFGNPVISGDSRLAIYFFPDLFTWKPVNLRDPNQSAGQMQETKQSCQLLRFSQKQTKSQLILTSTYFCKKRVQQVPNQKWFTIRGTNMSPTKAVMKMIFLFPRCDILFPWRVCRVNEWISKAHPSTLPRQSK